jgi:hypothetical protein
MCVLVVSLLVTKTAPMFLFILVRSFVSERKSPFSLEQTVVPDVTLVKVKVNLPLYLRNTARV